jgi:hypothetical protein
MVLASSVSEKGPVADPCEHGKVHSGSVKGGEFLYLYRLSGTRGSIVG